MNAIALDNNSLNQVPYILKKNSSMLFNKTFHKLKQSTQGELTRTFTKKGPWWLTIAKNVMKSEVS